MQQRLRDLTIVVLAVSGLALASGCAPEPPAYDLWIRNGTVIDGTGSDRFAADVLVRGDTIVFVGAVDEQDVKARRTIDARGKLVTPGFIDMHSHGDPTTQAFTNFLGQGITTVVLGQDGATPALHEESASLENWMRAVDERGSEVNIAALCGHGSLRTLAGVGNAPKPSPEQLEAMKRRLRSDLAAGAYGLSFGLEYAPDRYSRPAEQKALGDLVGESGGVVMSHMRSEDFDKIAGAIDELLQIDAPVHVSHLKIVAGQRAQEAQAVLDQLARARAEGRSVTADVYPYLASASSLYFLYPEWAKSSSAYEEAVKTRRAELEAHLRKRVEERNGPQAILFVDGPHAGKRLRDLAKQFGKPYERVIIDDIGYGGPAQAHFLMSKEVMDVFIGAEHVAFCTDGAPASHHPRSYGSFVKILEQYVGEAPAMSFERAIHKMAGLPAQILGLDRGVLAQGRKADIVVLSPGRLDSRASWAEPQLQPSGLDFIIVNGAVAFENGAPVNARHGRMLRRTDGARSADL